MTSASHKPQSFRAASILDQVVISEPAVDPSGGWVVYARRTIDGGRYRERLWRIDADGGQPAVLAEQGERAMRPRISPDGSTVLFLLQDGATTGAWVVPVHGGPAEPVAPNLSQVTAAEWCPDGTHVALLAPSGEERFAIGDPGDPVGRRVTDLTWRLDGSGIRDQFTSLWHAAIDGSSARRLTPPSFDVSAVLPSPGGSIGFLADRSPEAGIAEHPQVHAVDPATGEISEVASLAGSVWAAAYSRGGRLAMVGTDEPGDPGWATIGVFVADALGIRRLGGSIDRHAASVIANDIAVLVEPPHILWEDETHVVAVVTDRGGSLPYRFGLDGSVEALVDADSVCGSIAAGGGVVVGIATDGPRTAELCRVDAGRWRPLTDHGSAWFGPYQRTPERVAIPHPDGHTIDAWYLPPRGVSGPAPWVLEIHGGAPMAAHGSLPQAVHLALADAGIGVIWSNPRGSGGYGRAFAPDDACTFFPAASDLVRVVDWTIERGLADPDRIGVTGISYGGQATHFLLAHDPDRFRAAVSESPITDMVTGLLTSDIYFCTDLPFPEELDRMIEVSAYRLLARGRAAVLLIQPDEDHRCPPSQSELAFGILRRTGRPVEMIRYPGESHAMSDTGRPDRRVDRLERIVDWFTRYL